MSASGWAVLIGLAHLLAARPLARVGEWSSAVLSGNEAGSLPGSAHPALVWVLQGTGLALVVIGLLV